MKFIPIFAGIQTILSADADTKDIIKLYRKYTFEPGINKTPFCLFAKGLTVGAFKGIGTTKQLWDGEVTVMFLGESYENLTRHDAVATVLDALQHNAYQALAGDVTLSGSVKTSKIDKIESVALRNYQGTFEYFGHQMKLSVVQYD